MSKYTPGPWKRGPIEEVEQGALLRRTIPIYDPRHNQPKWSGKHIHPVIAEVWWHPDESEANARLIAAAPELLEALKGVMGLLDSGYLVRNTDDDHKPDFALRQIEPVAKLKAAMDAIAKATGRDGGGV